MLMSNLLYHKELTDVQWEKIKFLFEKPRKVGRPSLNPRMVLNGILWILRSTLARFARSVIGTASTTKAMEQSGII